MDQNTTTQKKRPGKPSGKINIMQKQQQLQEQETETCPSIPLEASNSSKEEEIYHLTKAMHQTTDLDNTASSASPALISTSDNPVTATTVNAECRRSSRKKIIKFDVRDLLNKNRKPHKIQIEARIDSNAPVAISSAATLQNAGAISSVASCSSTPTATDLTSKQKTFIEKSAIFRRYSISAEQQNKMASAQRPPLTPATKLNQSKISLLSKLGSEDSDESTTAEADRVKIAQARRLSRTQEIFNANMIKSKQNSSLIIAQMESSSVGSNATTRTQAKAKSTAASPKFIGDQIAKQESVDKREGMEKPTPPLAAQIKVQRKRGRPPKNKPKDALNSLAVENHAEGKPKVATSGINQETTEEKQIHKPPASNDSSISKTIALTPEKAKNWQEYKACLRVTETQPKTKPVVQMDSEQSTVILEISSSSSESDLESDALKLSPNANGNTKQRNFAAVSFLQEVSSSFNDNVTATEFIVAAVEEIVTEQTTEDSCINSCNMYPLSNEHLESSEGILCESDEKILNEVIFNSPPSIGSSAHRIGGSSSSESEASSDRSQTKAYKEGDKLRVSLKRLSPQKLSPPKGSNTIPTNPGTSARSSSRSSTLCSSSGGDTFSDSPLFKTEVLNITRKRKYLKKQSKRMEEVELQKELGFTSVTNNTVSNIEETELADRPCKSNENLKDKSKSNQDNLNKTKQSPTPRSAQQEAPFVSISESEVKTINSKTAGESVKCLVEGKETEVGINYEDNETPEKETKEEEQQGELSRLPEMAEDIEKINNEVKQYIDNEKEESTEVITVQQDEGMQEIIFVELAESGKVEEFSINQESNEPRVQEDQEKENVGEDSKEREEGRTRQTEKGYNEIKASENERETQELEKDYDEINELRKELQIEREEKDEVNSKEIENQNTEDLIIQELSAEELIAEELQETLNEKVIENDNFMRTENARIDNVEDLNNLITSIDPEVRELADNKEFHVQNDNEEIEMEYSVHTEFNQLSQKDTIGDNPTPSSDTSTIISSASIDHSSKIVPVESNTAYPELAEKEREETEVPPFSETEEGVESLDPDIIPFVANEEIVEAEIILPEALEADPSVPMEKTDTKHILDAHLHLLENKTTIELLPKPKEPIKLPPKKQLKKFHIFSDAVKTTKPASPKFHSLVNQITDQVNVETKTLLDILKTVQSNESAAVATNKPACPEIGKDSEIDFPHARSTGRTSSPHALIVKKTTSVRRYERRSRRVGEEEFVHKTLEETFAEIAEQSSKEILERFTNRNDSNSSLGSEVEKCNKEVSNKEVFEKKDKNSLLLERETADATYVLTESQDTSGQHILDYKRELIDSEEASKAKVIEVISGLSVETHPKKNSIEKNSSPKEINQNVINDHASTSELEISAGNGKMTERKMTSTPTKRGRKPKAKSKEILQSVSECKADDKISTTEEIVNTTESIMKEVHIQKTENETVTSESQIISNQEPVRSQEKTDEVKSSEKSEGSSVFIKTDSVSKIPEKNDPGDTQKTEDPSISVIIESDNQIIESLGKVTAPNDVHDAAPDPELLTKETEKACIENEKETMKEESLENKVYQTSINSCTAPPAAEVVNPETAISSLENAQIDIVDESNAEKTAKEKCEKIPISPPKKRFLKTQMGATEERLAQLNKNDQTLEANSSKKKSKKVIKTSTSSKDDSSNVDKSKATASQRGLKSKKLTPEKKPDSTVSQSQASNKKSSSSKKAAAAKSSRSPESNNSKRSEKKTKRSDKKVSESDNNTEHKPIATGEKSSKKKRQKKLQEAFEAALIEVPPTVAPAKVNLVDDLTTQCEKKPMEKEILLHPHISPEQTLPSNTPSETVSDSNATKVPADFAAEPSKTESSQPAITPSSTIEPEEDPDPLKDIEKFIEDGVNLLKRGYKIDDNDDDSVDGAILNAAKKLIKEDLARTPLNLDALTSFVDTPADTPLATPTVTPPPKSPIGLDTTSLPTSEDSYTTSGGVRRSHRIKQNSKAPKALVGRGLVRDKERLSLKDDVETKSHYTIDDHRMDLAEVEAKNAKFLKDMEERLSNFRVIKENEYKCERVVSKEAKKMICDCFLTAEEEERGELGCGEDCLNRLLMIECGPDCNVKERCTNKRFQLFLSSPCRVFRTEKKGFGIMADVEILPGEFIMEYAGEVINGDEFERRRIVYSLDKNRHYYFMALRSDAIIDATNKGNISRFINHSCEPNAETQKWTVNGELRIGFFSKRSIIPGEEITFDYQYQRYGREAQRCYCESANCRGWIGEEPNSDEGEQIDDDSDGDEEEEENLAESLLADDDEDDSDETDDAEEAQKKLEIAAAEAKLMPITDQDKSKLESVLPTSDKKKKSDTDSSSLDGKRGSVEEDSKSKLKKLLNKMAEKVAKRKKQKERRRRKRDGQEDAANSGNRKLLKARYLEDRDIEDEVNFLSRCGLKNQSDTLRFSRLMVRAKIVQTRLNLLKILRNGELPCRRLFLDYHGLRLLHGWMSEDGGNLDIRLAMLEALETLPITNKTVLTDSKVYQAVRSWCSNGTGPGSDGAVGNSLSPSDESSKESTNSQPKPAIALHQEVPSELKNLALKLTNSWDSLPEIFRIPKRERIEQMKEHEREADRQYADAAAWDEEEMGNSTSNSDRYHRDRFGRGGASNGTHRPSWSRGNNGKEPRNISTLGTISNSDPRRRGTGSDNALHSSNDTTKHLSKEQRREMFAAKVARDEAEKRLAEERREFETKCRFFGLDPKKTRPHNLPFCVNPNTGQWYSTDKQPIPTPPSYAHVQVPVKAMSTNPADYQLPASATNLPPKWKSAITPQGKIYYYHIQHRVPQWEPPTPAQIYGSAAAQASAATASDSGSDGEANDSSDDDYEIIKDMDAAKLQAYVEQKIGLRRVQRYNKLVDERSISPRREEDRIYNQIEVRKYKENKEKIRKRKEEIRRRRIESLKNATLNMCTLGGLDEVSAGVADAKQTIKTEPDESDALPIQDYLLSSDEDETINAECNNSPLLDKIVQGDKIVDELDALTTKRPLKRALPPHGEINTGAASKGNNEMASGSSISTTEKSEHHKKRKVDKRESRSGKKSRDQDSKYRKMKEKFRGEIAGIIVHHLKPYRKDGCIIGRIQSNEDFNHLAKKLTHFVMIKELKYCESVGQTLVVTESVKNKSREFIKKYMAKYGDVYVKPDNDPDFKDIPFSL